MAAFTQDEREAIFLEHQDGGSISEIAKSLDKTYQSIRSAVRSQWYQDMESGVDTEDSQVTIEEAIEAVEEPVKEIDSDAEALLEEVQEEIEEEYDDEEDFDYEEEE